MLVRTLTTNINIYYQLIINFQLGFLVVYNNNFQVKKYSFLTGNLVNSFIIPTAFLNLSSDYIKRTLYADDFIFVVLDNGKIYQLSFSTFITTNIYDSCSHIGCGITFFTVTHFI